MAEPGPTVAVGSIQAAGWIPGATEGGGANSRNRLAIARRGTYTPAQWETWLTALTPKLGDEKLAYNDEAWLARRHDLLAFLTALYLEADRSDDAALQALEGPIVAALKSVP